MRIVNTSNINVTANMSSSDSGSDDNGDYYSGQSESSEDSSASLTQYDR